ncbi:MAG TPA: AMP-binding protein, partial [Thermodesulfobacteriota bacterium]|nr:AMP-binding protein [Thermodesulfobacteriota bacterium]
KELNETVNRIANALIEAGMKKGDRIGIALPRIPELVISFLAISKAGGIVAPINFELKGERIRDILITISPRLIIVHEQFQELIKKAIPAGSSTATIIVGEKDDGDSLYWEEMLKNSNSQEPAHEVDENDVVYLNYTSGSTGNSRGAVTTHSNIYWNTHASVNALALTAEDLHLCMFAPFAHPHEIFARPLYLGGTIVLQDNIYPKSIAKTISSNNVTCMMGLAPMYETLLEALEHKNYDLGSLRVPESGGMHTRADLIQRFEKKIGVPILPVWGSTETTGIALANTPGERLVYGSVGKPCPTYETRIVDEMGEDVATGEIGELIFKGPAVVSGYYKEGQDNSSFRNGWYYSGDLGRRDIDGNFFFVDRKSGMMKVAGLKVYPMEVELALMEHPYIKEAAVIASKDRLRGEVPKAIIVTRDGNTLTDKEVLEFCRGKLPNYKIPKIMEFRESLPKIGSGKINKKELAMEELSRR